MNADKKIVHLNCPGKKVPIRTAPNIQAELVRYAVNNEKIQVYNKTTGGFFKLVDGTGFMNKATKGVEWIDLPIVEEVPEPPVEVEEVQPEVEEIQQNMERDLNLNTYEQPNEPEPTCNGEHNDYQETSNELSTPPPAAYEAQEEQYNNNADNVDNTAYEPESEPEPEPKAAAYSEPTRSVQQEEPVRPSTVSKFADTTPKCALCNKSVFPAEKIQAINRIWHKSCFCCGGSSVEPACKKVLTLTTYLSHGEDPFCKACHGKLFGPKGFGYGITGSAMTLEAKTNNSNKQASEGDTAAPPAAPSMSIGQIAKAPAVAPKFAAAPKCAFCDTSVFPAEKTLAINRTWHKHCFKCGGTSNDGGCGKVLTLDKYLSHGEDPFCKPCHTKLFGPKGFGSH